MWRWIIWLNCCCGLNYAQVDMEILAAGVQPQSGVNASVLNDVDGSTCLDFSTTRGLGPRAVTKLRIHVVWPRGYRNVTVRGDNLQCAGSETAELYLRVLGRGEESSWCGESNCHPYEVDTSLNQRSCTFRCLCPESRCTRLQFTYRSKRLPVQSWSLCDVYDGGLPNDCAGYLDLGYNEDGVYPIRIATSGGGHEAKDVFCDLTTDGGGWTVLFRRVDGSVNFADKLWDDYKEGFGDQNEYWIGNDAIHQLTMQLGKLYKLRFDLGDFLGNTSYAEYSFFGIESETENYTVYLGQYSGEAGNAFQDTRGMQFSTADRDNDAKDHANCAAVFKGGYWYSACHRARLTGRYGEVLGYAQGMTWFGWLGYHTFLSFAEMKISPVPQSCHEYATAGYRTSGVYGVNLKPPGEMPEIVDVFCDLEGGAGYTFLLRREDASVNFNRNWAAYKDGFGTLTREFWIGNEKIHRLTSLHDNWNMTIHLESFDNTWRIVYFDNFYVDSEGNSYTVTLNRVSGTPAPQFILADGAPFSTYDLDNDASPVRNCAADRFGGWWFTDCGLVNPTGLYNTNNNAKRIHWCNWLNDADCYTPIKSFHMKIRPADF